MTGIAEKNSIIEIDSDAKDSIHLTTMGDGNLIRIGKPLSCGNVRITVSQASVSIGDGCSLGHLLIHAARGSRVTIGDGVAFNGLVRLLLHEPASISIGSGCLFAGGIDVSVSDMHSIVDMASGSRINPANDVFISPKVWIGQNAMILKGVRIGEGSVVGACSVVTRDVPENCIAAGNPARIIRTGICWRKELIL